MLNIVIPMAGKGTRFLNQGYFIPKPLIEIHGKPMIEYVIKNLKPKIKHKFYFICLKDHIDNFKIDSVLKSIEKDSIIISIENVTRGASETVLLAKKFINNKNPLMIANSDQFINFDINDYLDKAKDFDGAVMTMKANTNKWSYAKINDFEEIIEIKEKEIISDFATTGIYNFSKGTTYVKYAEKMIKENLLSKNEFYVAPVFNLLIKDKAIVKSIFIGDINKSFYGLGIPEDLSTFKKSEVSKNVFK